MLDLSDFSFVVTHILCGVLGWWALAARQAVGRARVLARARAEVGPMVHRWLETLAQDEWHGLEHITSNLKRFVRYDEKDVKFVVSEELDRLVRDGLARSRNEDMQLTGMAMVVFCWNREAS